MSEPDSGESSPEVGFNNNVRHRGRRYHIQTEDSGQRHPHVVTHLFADGGRIVKSARSGYAEYLGSPQLSQRVRSLMREQHKAMFLALRDGRFDALLSNVNEAPAPSTAQVASEEPDIELGAEDVELLQEDGIEADSQRPSTAAARYAPTRVAAIFSADSDASLEDGVARAVRASVDEELCEYLARDWAGTGPGGNSGAGGQ